MKTTLVSFIGRKPRGGYQEATYDFGAETRTTSFFGRAVADFCRPDRMVILGTSGSMWDILLDHLSDTGTLDDDVLALLEGSEEQSVTQELLDRVSSRVEEGLGIPCRLTIIPFGRDEREQMEILRLMVKDIQKNEQVILDLTHGLRHLPMLAFLSALYLESAKSATIKKIYYGAFDLAADGVTPVLQLDGLLRTAHWIRALDTYDKDGDYSVFEPLLEREGLSTGSLAEAAFYERCSNPEKARGKLTGFSTEKMKSTAVAGLFANPLRERIAWFRGQTRSEWETSLAQIYFDKKDYLRAVIYALESLVTHKIEDMGGNVSNFDERKTALTALRNSDETIADFSNLRNSLTHGVKSTDRGAATTLKDEARLREVIRHFIGQYLNKKRP